MLYINFITYQVSKNLLQPPGEKQISDALRRNLDVSVDMGSNGETVDTSSEHDLEDIDADDVYVSDIDVGDSVDKGDETDEYCEESDDELIGPRTSC